VERNAAKGGLFNTCAREGSETYINNRADWYELDTAHEDVEHFKVVDDAVTTSVSQCTAVSECKESYFLKQIKSEGIKRIYA
jgi:hypothetical protein